MAHLELATVELDEPPVREEELLPDGCCLQDLRSLPVLRHDHRGLGCQFSERSVVWA